MPIERKTRRLVDTLALLVAALSLLAAPAMADETQTTDTLRAVFVTGGHDFPEKPMLDMFGAMEGVSVTHAPQRDHSEIFESIEDWEYDVIILYHMTQEISGERRENLRKLLRRGVGVVAMHHALGAFDDWPEYRKIIGGRYLHKEVLLEGGGVRPASDYAHDIDFDLQVKDPDHPITRGMSDFSVHDETYGHCVFEDDNRVLLATDAAGADGPMVWVREREAARVCYIMPGHGPDVFVQAEYQKLVERAIRWCAGRLE